MKLFDSMYVPEEIQCVMGAVDTFVRAQSVRDSHRSYLHYHPSDLGSCLRKAQYKRYRDMGLLDVKDEEFKSQLLRLFGKGHNMQARWCAYFQEMHVMRGWWECANPLCRKKFGRDDKLGIFEPDKCGECGCESFKSEEVGLNDKELNISGHCDIILDFSGFDASSLSGVNASFNIANLPKKPFVVDMKTINDYGFKNKLGRQGPSLTYIIQLVTYCNILGVDYGVLIYENKNNSEVKSFKIPRSEKIWEQIRKQVTLMNEMASLSPPKLPPPRPDAMDCYECSKCAFRKFCHQSTVWSDPNLVSKRKSFYGNLLEE